MGGVGIQMVNVLCFPYLSNGARSSLWFSTVIPTVFYIIFTCLGVQSVDPSRRLSEERGWNHKFPMFTERLEGVFTLHSSESPEVVLLIVGKQIVRDPIVVYCHSDHLLVRTQSPRRRTHLDRTFII